MTVTNFHSSFYHQYLKNTSRCLTVQKPFPSIYCTLFIVIYICGRFLDMRRINKFGKVLLLVTGLIALTCNATLPEVSSSVQENPQENTNQSEDNETYVQSFDVVSQNVQLQLSSIFLLGNQEIELVERPISLIKTSFKLASTKFFEILFEQIIAPNAP